MFSSRIPWDDDDYLPCIKLDIYVSTIHFRLSAVFACPYIWAFPYEPHSRVMSLIDEHTNPAYVPNFVSNNVAPYGFLQRIHELWKQIAVWCLQNL